MGSFIVLTLDNGGLVIVLALSMFLLGFLFLLYIVLYCSALFVLVLSAAIDGRSKFESVL
jgi:hypothetical protein